MPKKKSRITRKRQAPRNRERSAFPILLILVMSMIVLGMFQYLAVLVAGSVIFVGFFSWLWWTQRAASATATKKKVVPRGKRKARKL